MIQKNQQCKHFVWIRETRPLRYVGFCLLGQCLCFDDECLFYEEEKDDQHDRETVHKS